MTTEEYNNKFDKIKQKTIARLLGDECYPISSDITTCKYINNNKQRVYDMKLDECAEYFKQQYEMRNNGGRLVRIIEDNPEEIPPPIK